MTDRVISWRGADLRMVPAVEVGYCQGCIYEDDNSSECPKNDDGETMCYSEHERDYIFIEDTPVAVAAYIANKLDPSHEDDNDDNDHLYT